MYRNLLAITASLMVFGFAGSALAINALQLGEGTFGDWTYDTTTQTWVAADNPFEVLATANATDGNGAYAWDAAGSGDQLAYIVVAATPQTADATDVFDVTLMNDGGSLTLVQSGFGAPPTEDSNSLASHGIYDTYYEIYEFDFDGPVTTISDTQPGETGTGNGFEEFITVTINSISEGLQIHLDLFTFIGTGDIDDITVVDNQNVKANAPFSHDAETGPGTPPVPEPTAALCFGVGLAAFAAVRRHRS